MIFYFLRVVFIKNNGLRILSLKDYLILSSCIQFILKSRSKFVQQLLVQCPGNFQKRFILTEAVSGYHALSTSIVNNIRFLLITVVL